MKSRLAPYAVAGLLALGSSGLVAAGGGEMALTLDPDGHTLEGELTRVVGDAPFHFRLGPDATLLAVSVDGEVQVSVPRSGGRFRVALSDSPAEVIIQWRATLPASPSPRASYFLGGEGGLLPAGTGWYPEWPALHDEPLAITLNLPQGQRGVASGSWRPGEDRHGVGHHQHPPGFGVTVVTGPWLERRREVDGVVLRTLFPEGLDQQHAEDYLVHSAEHLRLFRERIGPLPYTSFTIAATPLPVGYAFPGLTVMGERVIPLPFILDTSLAHELMHAWWGAGIRVARGQGNWSEAMTTYMADYALAERRGEGVETRRRWLFDLEALPTERDFPLERFQARRDESQRIVGYNRGALLLHMVHQQIGDGAFDQAVRSLSQEFRFREAGWSDLVAHFEAAGEVKLAPLFAAVLGGVGQPALALSEVNTRREGSRWHLEGLLSQRGTRESWPLHVPLHVEADGETTVVVLPLTGERTPFNIVLEAPAESLRVDPEHHLLRAVPQAPLILRGVTLHPDRLLVVPEGGDLGRAVAATFGIPPHSDGSFDPERPMLLVGTRAAVDRWLARQGVPEPPRAVGEEGYARMWTVPGTRLAVVSGENPEAVVALARSLRHHGHRGYVVRDAAGETLASGRWPLQESELHWQSTTVGD